MRFGYLILLCIITGCGSKQSSQKHIDQWRYQEARLYDIPVMLDAIPDISYQLYSDDEQAHSIAYTVKASFDEIMKVYTEQMERLGWRSVASIKDSELLLLFEKPHKLVVVSVRPYRRDHAKVVITQVET